MHREIVKPTRDHGLSVMWTSLGLVVLLIAIVGFSNLMYNRYGISYSGYIAFALYILIGIYVYRRKIMGYQYSLIGDEMIFESLAGKRSREILRINLNEVLYFCPLSYEKRDENTTYKNHFLILDRRSPKAYVMAFKGEENIHRVIFEPSEELITLIKNV